MKGSLVLMILAVGILVASSGCFEYKNVAGQATRSIVSNDDPVGGGEDLSVCIDSDKSAADPFTTYGMTTGGDSVGTQYFHPDTCNSDKTLIEYSYNGKFSISTTKNCLDYGTAPTCTNGKCTPP